MDKWLLLFPMKPSVISHFFKLGTYTILGSLMKYTPKRGEQMFLYKTQQLRNKWLFAHFDCPLSLNVKFKFSTQILFFIYNSEKGASNLI